jgi:hypothetical protein
MVDRPITKNSWNPYTIKNILGKKAGQLYFGGIPWRNGSYQFDDFKLLIANTTTNEFEEIPIDNAGFENKLKRIK